MKDPIDALTPKLVEEKDSRADFVYGSLAGDDSHAVIAAHEALANGGSAADAAVAMYFTLAVTQPATAGLGGGGVCLVHNPLAGAVEVLDFIPPPATGEGKLKVAVPGNVRGMAALHARFGRLGWSQLVRVAEDMARDGVPMSRSLNARLEAHAGRLYGDRDVQAIFADPNGLTLAPPTRVQQLELGALLGQIRARGAGDFYTGPLAHTIAQSVQAEGGNLRVEDLRNFLPQWRAPVSVPMGGMLVSVPPPPAALGLVEAQTWQMLSVDNRYAQASAAERPHLLVETVKRALVDRTGWLAPDSSSRQDSATLLSDRYVRGLMTGYQSGRATAVAPPAGTLPAAGADASGFVIVDGQGVGVACTVSLFNDFGTGRMAQRTGFFLAPPPGYAANSVYGMAPLMVTEPATRRFRYAATGGGGSEAASAAVQTTLATLVDGLPLRDAIAQPRVHHPGWPDQAVVERSLPDAARNALASRGHALVAVPAIGRVNAVDCPTGIPNGREPRCISAPDPRGEGLGLNLEASE
ncbi:MAG: gamma-glutamyltransferase [Alphaproteobacteria bacterium]